MPKRGYVRVELLSGRDLVLDPPPGRVFLVAPHHDLCDLSAAIDRAFGRWDLSHLHEFELADGTRLGHDPDEEVGWSDEHDHLVLGLGDPGTEFTYVFDLGDGWTHRCIIEGTDERPDLDDDTLDEFELPVPVHGWGDLPDQYGRTTPDE